MKLAFVDLDGVVADNTKRFEKAESRKEWHRANLYEALKPELDNPTNQAQVRKGLDDFLENLFWQRVFDSELVNLDTLIDGVHEALDQLQRDGYSVMLLTSRPESMRQATESWLANKALMMRSLYAFELIMKAPAFQYTKTPVWKAGMVQTLAMLYGAGGVLFIDDEQANIDEILKHMDTVTCFKSLAEAVEVK
jgi:hypothetical protein